MLDARDDAPVGAPGFDEPVDLDLARRRTGALLGAVRQPTATAAVQHLLATPGVDFDRVATALIEVARRLDDLTETLRAGRQP